MLPLSCAFPSLDRDKDLFVSYPKGPVALSLNQKLLINGLQSLVISLQDVSAT